MIRYLHNNLCQMTDLDFKHILCQWAHKGTGEKWTYRCLQVNVPLQDIYVQQISRTLVTQSKICLRTSILHDFTCVYSSACYIKKYTPPKKKKMIKTLAVKFCVWILSNKHRFFFGHIYISGRHFLSYTIMNNKWRRWDFKIQNTKKISTNQTKEMISCLLFNIETLF